MTALLTADEAARLRVGVNVIVRPGDRCLYHKGHDRTAFTGGCACGPPQDWVALTGPCPTCEGSGAVEVRDRYESAMCLCDGGPGPYGERPCSRCGGSGMDVIEVDPRGPCPDCRDGRRIVPLYTECPNEPRHLIDRLDCDLCDDEWRVQVGRGSIEVVPVVDSRTTGNLPEKCIVVWVGHAEMFDPDLSADRWAMLWTQPDPLPVPGRDFGIVVDVTELA